MKAPQGDISVSTIFMPDGSPAPYLLTPDEAVKFLRIENVNHPENTLRYYRESGKLRATRVGKYNFYSIISLLEFIAELTPKKDLTKI